MGGAQRGEGVAQVLLGLLRSAQVVEADLQGRGLIGAGFLDPYKARILLWTLLTAGAGRDSIAAAFAAAFAAAGGTRDPTRWPWPTPSQQPEMQHA